MFKVLIAFLQKELPSTPSLLDPFAQGSEAYLIFIIIAKLLQFRYSLPFLILSLKSCLYSPIEGCFRHLVSSNLHIILIKQILYSGKDLKILCQIISNCQINFSILLQPSCIGTVIPAAANITCGNVEISSI